MQSGDFLVMNDPRSPEEVALAAQLAALLEVAAEKPGNVTPRHAFADTRLTDFLASAAAIGPAMRAAGSQPVGATVLQAIRATRRVTRANTNLGIVLLFSPLARAARRVETPHRGGSTARVRDALAQELRALTVEDAVQAYEAIRLANPGGLGAVPEEDVSAVPTVTLRDAMALAAHRDSVAREYVTDYAITFEIGLPALHSALAAGLRVEEAVTAVFLTILGCVPDTLIARKLGRSEAEAISARARALVPTPAAVASAATRQALAGFDIELRDGYNRRNPGATADLTAATLFAALLTEGPEAIMVSGGSRLVDCAEGD